LFAVRTAASTRSRTPYERPVSNVIEVPVITLDEYIAQNHVERLDFMKVDVEGAEGLVLAGAKELLRDPARLTCPRFLYQS
jgi:FkbM family methyltransferase